MAAAAPALASAALKYAKHGWLVFPCWWPLADGSCACSKGTDCDRPGKHPLARLAPNGLLDATTDEAIVAGWWTQYPLANIAIRTGSESGLVVLDIDAYKGGMFSFEDLEARHGTVPYSIRAKTGSGGGSAHVYLGHPRDGRRISSNASGKLGAGLDVKADGGYVIAPPSLHYSGGRYTWLDVDNSQIEPAPSWLLGLLGTTNGEPVNPINTGIELPEEQAKALADEWFARAALRVEGGAPRHDTWVWFVVQMKDSAVPLPVVTPYVDEYLRLAAEMGATRKVTERELVGALNWAYGKARRDPLPAARRALEAPPEPAEPAQPPPAEEVAPHLARTAPLDVLLSEPDVPIVWLVENLISQRAIGMLVAEAYMAKSTLAACLALHIAAGKNFLRWRIDQARPVLYWQTEGSVQRFKKRIAVAAAYYSIDIAGLPLYLERSGLGEDYRTPAFRAIAERARGGLVITDTSGAFYFGDENSAEEVREGWIRPLKTVTVAANVAILTVHHHGKPSKEREAHHKGRGSSALFGDADTWIRMEKVTGHPTHREIAVDKVRETEEQEPLEVEFLADRAAFALVDAADQERAVEEEERKAILGYAAAFETAVGKSEGLATKQIEELCPKAAHATKQAARAHLVEQNRVRFEGKNGTKLFWFRGEQWRR